MKKYLLLSATLLMAVTATQAQVGIGTDDPKATLDVKAENPTGTSTTTDGILIPHVDRQRAQNMASVETSTLIYVNDISTGTATGQAEFIDAPGFYSFDGNKWQKFGAGDLNIYKDNGTLTANRTVTMSDKTLSFNSSATTGTSHFNVDGSTFNVDAVNNKIGIGTNNPSTKLEVNNGSTAGAIKIVDGTQQDGRVLTSDASGVGTWQALSLGNKTATWHLKGTNTFSIGETATQVTGTGNFIGENQIGATLTNSSLTLPAGKYLIFIHFDVAGPEYGIFNMTDSNNVVFTTYYGEMLDSSFLCSSSSSIVLKMYFRGFPDPPSTYYSNSYPNTTFDAIISILKLN